jgi:hypothetical protein
MYDIEKRRFPRISSCNALRLLNEIGGDTPPYATSQLGIGGCLVLTPAALNVGEIKAMEIAVGTTLIRTISKVIYEVEEEYGVEFLYIEERDMEVLEEFLNQRLPH